MNIWKIFKGMNREADGRRLHPHLHCMVPAGGLDQQGQWKFCKSKGKYLFNREVMGLVFRARYVKLLRKAIKNGQIPPADIPSGLFKNLFRKNWITYAKQPFIKPKHVLNYIGRYSHSIAITNHRIQGFTKSKVTFSYKNYRKAGKKEVMQLDQWEFLRRFVMHIVPHRFIRIRHYGILSNRRKTKALLAAKVALGVKESKNTDQEKTTFDPLLPPHYCSCCKRTTPHLIVEILPPIRAGPSTNVLSKS